VFGAFPKKLVTIVVKLLIVERLTKFIVYDGDQRAVVEIAYGVIFWARVSHPVMKRHRDVDWRPLPSRILIHPFRTVINFRFIEGISGQCFVDLSPVYMPYICWYKSFISNDGQKLLKARLGLLDPMVPIPVAEEESILVRKRSKRLCGCGGLCRQMLQTLLIIGGL
jgi:hypothetical protein